MQSDEVVHHPVAQQQIQSFGDIYAALKKPRKLYPITHLGHIEIDLDFKDGSTRTFSVNPVQVHILYDSMNESYICRLNNLK